MVSIVRPAKSLSVSHGRVSSPAVRAASREETNTTQEPHSLTTGIFMVKNMAPVSVPTDTIVYVRGTPMNIFPILVCNDSEAGQHEHYHAGSFFEADLDKKIASLCIEWNNNNRGL